MPISNSNTLIKKAYLKVQYTKQELYELTACMHPVTGPMYFMENFLWIQHPTRGREKFTPYPFQRTLVETYHGYRKSINMVSRQMGKCVTAETDISVRHKNGKIYDIPVGMFYEYNCAKQNNTEKPDISSFERRESR